MFQKGTPAKGDERLTDFMVSEKLDGLRAAWDGEQFISREGNVFPAPINFKDHMPSKDELDYYFAGGILDGELYIGRGQFQRTSGIIRGACNDWLGCGVHYHAFDVMEQNNPFVHRQSMIDRYTLGPGIESPVISVEQWDGRAMTWDSVMGLCRDVVANGGEGLMLHRKQSSYRPGRNMDILKVKIPDYGVVVVDGHFDGKGKYAGMVGGYHCTFVLPKAMKQVHVRIGSGLTDMQRREPLSNGTKMPVRYWGTFKSGKARQPVFAKLTDLPVDIVKAM